jgi:hypothetical protein
MQIGQVNNQLGLAMRQWRLPTVMSMRTDESNGIHVEQAREPSKALMIDVEQ